MKDEEWKQIVINDVQYDYLISNHGRVFSLKSQKLLKPHKKDNGYLNTNLRNNGENHVFLIHCLVAIHFIPNDDEEKTEKKAPSFSLKDAFDSKGNFKH